MEDLLVTINRKELVLTNIPMMDQQHNDIFDIGQTMFDAFQNLETKEALLPICHRLFNLCRQHFDDEERLMLKYFYPHTESHIGQHMEHTNILATLINNINTEAYGDAMDTLAYLMKWHINHISQDDHQYAVYIHSKSA